MFPKEQIVEMQLDQGWEPLAKFLNRPIPQQPFPRANDRDEVDRIASKIIRTALGVWVGIFVSVGMVVYAARVCLFTQTFA
jgi:hypothetical protein